MESRIDEETGYLIINNDLVIMPLSDYKSLKERAESGDTAKGVVDNIARYTTYSWYEEHKGAKKGCGRMADAMIIANAVRGMSLAEIQAQHYPYKKGGVKKYEIKKITRALSVKKPDDPQRIQSLMEDFPDVFSDIDREQVDAWMQKRAKKGNHNILDLDIDNML